MICINIAMSWLRHVILSTSMNHHFSIVFLVIQVTIKQYFIFDPTASTARFALVSILANSLFYRWMFENLSVLHFLNYFNLPPVVVVENSVTDI